MCRTGNARIVIANGLFALPGKLFLRKIEIFQNELMKIALYYLLILRGGRNYLCLKDHTLIIYLIPMIENTAWRFSATIPDPGSWLKIYSCPLWRFVFIDNAQRLVAGIED